MPDQEQSPSPTRALTRLVLPVPEVEGLVPFAHISLLDPFLPVVQVDDGVIAELRELFAEIVPFAFVLGEPARFPSGKAYLPPQPGGVLRRVSGPLRRAFPEVAGHPDSLHHVIAHLSLDDEAVGRVVTPVDVHARAATLLSGSDDETVVLATFGFGTSAA